MHLQLWDKKWFCFVIDHKCSTSSGWIRSTPVLSPCKPLESSLRSKPQFINPSSSNLQTADQDQVLQVNLILLRLIRYYFFEFHLRFFFLPFLVLDRLQLPRFWFPSRTNHHPISSGPWEPPTLLSSLKPNLREFLSKKLCRNPMNGKMLSKTGPCPQL
jgi:hypothetical protein